MDALDIHFSQSALPACLEVGPSLFVDFYRDQEYIDRFEAILVLSTFTFHRKEDLTGELRSVGREVLNFTGLGRKRGLELVARFQPEEEETADGIWAFQIFATK